MSIVAYTGLPGAYKTYSAVENWVLPALREGRTVAHNLRLHEDACFAASGGRGRLVQIPRYDTAGDGDPAGFERADELIRLTPCGAVSVIDEVWQYWPSGVPVSKVPRAHLSFFKEHRQRLEAEAPHRAAEILIIDQDLGTAVAYWIRALVEATYIHTKLDAVGASSRFRVDIYNRAQSLDKPREKQFTRACYGRFKQDIGDCYVTHAKTESAGAFEAGLEAKVDKRNTIWGSWRIKAAFVAALLLPFLFAGVYSQMRSLGDVGAATQEPPDSAHAVPAVAPPPGARPAVPARYREPSAPAPTTVRVAAESVDPPEPQLSRRWRLKGVVVTADGEGWALLSSVAGQRRVSARLCERTDSGGNWLCRVDGEIVTMWSGGAESALSLRRPPGSYDASRVVAAGD